METDYYRLLVEQVREYAIFVLSPDGFVASWNEGAARITGYQADEIIGKHFSVLYEPSDSNNEKADRELTIAFSRGRYEDYGWRMRKDGSRFWANVILTPIYNNNRDFIGFAKVIRDLTERKRAEENLLRSREEFRTLANSLPHIVFTADNYGFITYWNKSFYKYTGLSEDVIHQVTVPDTVHPDDVYRLRGLWREAVSTGENFEAEFRLKRYDGEYRWHLGRAVPLKNSTGLVLKWIGASVDVHEAKMSAEKKDEFIGIAGHELRTPLTSIKAYAQLLERCIDSDDKECSKQYIEKIYTFIDKLNKLIADLLDISKIQRGKMPLESSLINIDDLVKDCVEATQLSSRKHKIYIKGKVGLKVRGDKARLDQVLNNYLSNAIKYSPGCEKVEVCLEKENNSICITVRDFGIGIPKDQVKNVFNKFFRAQNTTNNIHGLGLGLYISAEIVRLHGGSVGVNSEEGKGSEFWFTLPLYSGPDRAAGPGDQKPSSFHA